MSRELSVRITVCALPGVPVRVESEAKLFSVMPVHGPPVTASARWNGVGENAPLRPCDPDVEEPELFHVAALMVSGAVPSCAEMPIRLRVWAPEKACRNASEGL